MEKTAQGKQREEEGEDPPWLLNTKRFIWGLVMHSRLPQHFEDKCSSIELIKGILRVERVDYGRISCAFTVEPHITNPYNTLHGGAVALIAEILAYACAGTVAAGKDFFLVELSTAYLAALRLHVQVYTDPDTFHAMGKDHAILISNHKSDIDWLVGWVLAQTVSYLGNALTIMKKSSKYLPLHVHIKRYPTDELPKTDSAIAQWCRDTVVEKDLLLDTHAAENTFGEQNLQVLDRPKKSLLRDFFFLVKVCVICWLVLNSWIRFRVVQAHNIIPFIWFLDSNSPTLGHILVKVCKSLKRMIEKLMDEEW